MSWFPSTLTSEVFILLLEVLLKISWIISFFLLKITIKHRLHCDAVMYKVYPEDYMENYQYLIITYIACTGIESSSL